MDATLEDRVAALEGAVKRIQSVTENPRKNWRRAVGMFAGDDLMMEIDREGERIRTEGKPADAQ